jgi:hypothetical protein
MFGYEKFRIDARRAVCGALAGIVALGGSVAATAPALSAGMPVVQIEKDSAVVDVRDRRWRKADRRHWDRRHWDRRHYRHHRHRDNGAWIGAGIAGLAAGALIGGALSGPRYYGYAEPRVVYVPRSGSYEPWSAAWYDYCESRYRSFDPRTGTFLGYDGRRHFCR